MKRQTNKKLWMLLTFVIICSPLGACTGANGQSATTPAEPTAPALPTPSPLPPSPTPIPTLDPSVGVFPQLMNDLSSRQAIPVDQISMPGIRFIDWQRTSYECPSAPNLSYDEEYVMIITEDGERYEIPTQNLRNGPETDMLIIFQIEEDRYFYYLIGNRYLFCP